MSDTATYFKSITPSDSTVFDQCDAVYIGGAGNLVADNGAGVSVTFAVTDGQVLPIKTTKILAATTATGIVALYD